MAKLLVYGDFPQACGPRDFVQEIIDHVLKEVPVNLRADLEGKVREEVCRGWCSFGFGWLEEVPDPHWKYSSVARLLSGCKDVSPEVREAILRLLHEASLWLLQRALTVLVLKHGRQQGYWDGRTETLDFDHIDEAELEVDMCVVEGARICELDHAVRYGKLVLQAVSLLVK